MEGFSAYYVNREGILCYDGKPLMQDNPREEFEEGYKKFCKGGKYGYYFTESYKQYEVWGVRLDDMHDSDMQLTIDIGITCWPEDEDRCWLNHGIMGECENILDKLGLFGLLCGNTWKVFEK